MQAAVNVVGVDVSKSELVTVVHGEVGSGKLVANMAGAIQTWLRTLKPGSVIAMEATGRYHRVLAELAHAAGMTVFVLNARDVHFYAKALGARGKTDRLDAAVIARYAAEHRTQLQVWHPATGVEQQLQDLLNRRWMLTRQLVTLRQSLRDVPTLQAAAHRLEQEYMRVFEEIDQQLEALVCSQDDLRQGVQRLRSITGIGAQASIRLGAIFSRVAFDNADAVVAYSGLDPRPSDSGAKKGKRRLSKRGSGELRRQLYLAAFAASRSKVFRTEYARLKAKGFATTQALVILARRLLRIAWAVWRTGVPFEPARFEPARLMTAA